MEIQSPSLTTIFFFADFDAELFFSVLIDVGSRAPTMQGSPIPRATTAAWLDISADRGQNSFRHFHAVNIIRRGFFADQNHWSLF